jgi:L-ascorbate metabolism protein UlaG (beta-lactamase superfamily)
LGHLLKQDQLKSIGAIDVLLIPVGGIYTIDANAATTIMDSLAPKICIPMHYKTPKLAFDLAPVTDFTNNKKNVKNISTSEIELHKNSLPKASEIWVLPPSKL